MCIDMKSFYASVEAVSRGLDPLQVHLAVVGSPDRKGSIVLAASPALKRDFGIKTGNRLYEIPQDSRILIVPARMKLYLDTSMMITQLLNEYAPIEAISIYSIDESWIVTDGLERLYGDIRSIAEHIQKKIMDLHGLPSAIGIGPNKLIAKLVLDNYAKKTGIAACSYQDVEKMFWPLPVENIWGIGERMKRNLNRMGIYLLGDLARTPLERMRKKFGLMGEQLFYHSWGVDLSPVFVDPREEMRKGFSSGITLMRDYSLQDVPVVIYELTDTLARKLRKIQAAAFTVSLSIGYSKHANIKGFSRSKTMYQASHTSKHLYETCLHLLKKHASPAPVRFIHVGVSNIIDAGTLQVDLFTAKQDEQLMKLGTVMDDIQKRFGPTALVRANALTEASTVINHSTKIGGHTG